ncbi:hypothetical protein L1F30_08720 [Simiduia sp. 21SJ11W-1]|uniref:hypothetical protein n=1 Tax=Simiduia sp. 21SJ11W-1 TaxID=2909669 RepID=UPI00209FC775|nr:hypothetical protein [Simiduia sp. 21SJ11W-1]UTA49604.1 hypothetical protein L1F30_08720 [Simiduia sp. 21SJ11W-1]
MKITLVKKILADGSPCKKCADVLEKLESGGHMARIDDVLVADERDPNSPGMLLADKLEVNRAPFFVVEKPDEEPLVYTVYLKFVRDILEQKTEAAEEATEILSNNPDLDFL